MSLSVDGVWKAGVWATTVWADGVWFEGERAAVTVVQTSGVKRRLKKYKKDENLEKLFPHLRDWEEEKQRERKERRKQLYPQTQPAVQLIEFPPMPGRAYVPIQYSPNAIRVDRSLDLIARQSDDEETEELIRLLGALDG